MNDAQECPICLQLLEEDIIKLPCNHMLHQLCYKTYLEYGYRNCCMCQKPIKKDIGYKCRLFIFIFLLLQLINTFVIIICGFVYNKIFRIFVLLFMVLSIIFTISYNLYVKYYRSIRLPR